MGLSLYTFSTPNGIKISIALELLKLQYKAVSIDIGKGEQKTPDFLKVSLNGRIPAITDTDGPGSTPERPFALFESGAILQYLADKYDPEYKISYKPGTLEHYKTNEWLFFQNAGVGPMQGQANHFAKFATEKVPYGIKRYTDETKRLYGVLEDRLKENGTGFLVGDHISIADISTVGWVQCSYFIDIDLTEFPEVNKWLDRLMNMEGVKKGFDVPVKWPFYKE
ncbi:Disulfide-bond oxidoreductase YfcG [Yarrowia sp. C11]|nr:Disulfide-bond oxidoreductase YfcG [Yarrowia sp. E02]KAG5365379.1 Disulfide-bond oxidoreductase YfcG [Yarrowia sp. C11]